MGLVTRDCGHVLQQAAGIWAGLIGGLRRRFVKLGARGATAVEFALVAPPLLLLLLTIIDLGVMLATQSVLDGAARDAARMIRTGQVQTQSSPITTFQNQLCADMTPLVSTATCQSSVYFQSQSFGNFGSVSFSSCNQNANQIGSGTVCNFSTGSGGQIIAVRATYNYPLIIAWVGGCLTGGSCWFGLGTQPGSTAGTNTVPLISTVIFQNEPFS